MRMFRFVSLLFGVLLVAVTTTVEANSIVWEAGKSLVDTTNYSNIGPYYWFANFNNPTQVTGAAADDHESRNLPGWIHLETRPAYIGKDDTGVNSDTTIRTGFSFEENGAHTAGDTTIGGQNGVLDPTTVFNTLTLPGGATGVSGQVVDPFPGVATTSSLLQIRIDAGAPESFRLWIVTDNGFGGANFHEQARVRLNLRDSVGAPTYADSSAAIEVEALPNGARIGQPGAPEGHNSIADAWAFKLGGVGVNDILTIKPTSGTGAFAGFAGLIIQPIPEPATATMVGIALAGFGLFRRSRRS